jgi:hypothetical protein
VVLSRTMDDPVGAKEAVLVLEDVVGLLAFNNKAPASWEAGAVSVSSERGP